RQGRHVIAERHVVTAQEVARVHSMRVKLHLDSGAKDPHAIDHHDCDQHNLYERRSDVERSARHAVDHAFEPDHRRASTGVSRASTLARPIAAMPATARNAARRSSDPSTIQVIAAITNAVPSQPATTRGRMSSSAADASKLTIDSNASA